MGGERGVWTTHMEISIQVVGGTHRTIRLNLIFNKQKAGELCVPRVEFTKLCDLLLGTYEITKNVLSNNEESDVSQ